MTRKRHLSVLRALPPSERNILFTALPLLLLVRVALWVTPFAALHRRWVSILPRLVRSPLPAPLPPARIAWLVSVASRFVPRAHCLTRAVVAQFLLARAGYMTEMHFGVRKDGERLAAHAWLEHQGTALFEDEAHLGGFTPFRRAIASPQGSVDLAK